MTKSRPIHDISTQELRKWLVSIRPAAPWPTPGEDAGAKEAEDDADTQALRVALDASELPQDRRDVLFNLGLFQKREAKPAQWAVFDSVGKDEDDLIDDLDALAGLEATGAAERVKRSMGHTYRFPPQETKLRRKDATVPVFDGPPATVSIEDLDRTAREITIKAGFGKAHLLTDRLTLHPTGRSETRTSLPPLYAMSSSINAGAPIHRGCGSPFRAVPRLTPARGPIC